ncbi:MAG TPA: ArsR family transcriptional regulator [Cyanobacteria bacterium UBA11149]|nr:ArsR family transcriptional regulator [Cyanobacteria bacterium UBA11367]HBE60684.1 ArsR family transcriptional regulator [Cyanobacteria bacterium UBA11366]HBK63894.1 ArsR family transcriptional regulator [Cyanobacteria bacterium UBA11166]HBR72987.1 ArsR family transcriptional regulator [Cyanobacteria bacterium UBA11159]HBS69440.1 ArsR family transcriptional regulator [Cyanobacteria bacterium UBA11153]HBW91957.1 ArsR family transcriptional regulator [Cyanobacteria bacterium UBA11149]HCA9602
MNQKNLSPPSFCARKLKVLADTTRLAVLQILMDGPKYVSEINAVLQIEQSLLSHHLKILRDEGFVEATRDGKSVLYHFIPPIREVNDDKVIDLGCCLLSFD